MFEKSQENFEKLLLKCREDHKIQIRKSLNFTEDRKIFIEKLWKRALKDLKQSSGKRNEHCKIRKKFSRNDKKNNIFDEKKFRRVKRVRFEEIVEICRKIHKVKIKINKKQKSYLKIDENTCEKETKAAGDEYGVKNTKKLPKSERNASKVKTANDIWKSIEQIEKFIFSKKVFRYLKEITNFLNEALKSEANRQSWKKPNNSNKFKFWNLQKFWKQALENEKKLSKTRNNCWGKKKLLIPKIDFDVEKNL